MHSWHVLEQTKTELERTDKLKNMTDNKGKFYMEESEVSKDYSEGSKCPWTVNSQGLGAISRGSTSLFPTLFPPDYYEIYDTG